MPSHTIVDGECIASIAFAYGFHPDTIWNDDANAQLRETRNPYALQAGDVVAIPELVQKTVARPTGKVHRFRRRGVPEKFRARLCEDGKPRAKVGYELTIGSTTVKGETDEDGRLEQWMPNDAQRGKLTVVRADGSAEVFELTFGNLAPIDSDEGVRRRLVNLGLLEAADSSDAAAVTVAVRAFQSANALTPSGIADEATRKALLQVYGG